MSAIANHLARNTQVLVLSGSAGAASGSSCLDQKTFLDQIFKCGAIEYLQLLLDKIDTE